MRQKILKIKGKIISLEKPVVMGILNVTPDSFYSESRRQNEYEITKRIETIIAEGGSIIDVGGYSTRPCATDVSVEEEWRRLEMAFKILNKDFPEVIISVDTFRASIAECSIKRYGAAIINDISAGSIDEQMLHVVADLDVPYVLMHMVGTPQNMYLFTKYDNITSDIIQFFDAKIKMMRQLGIKDIIIDPGFGFSKTTEGNYELMRHLHDFTLFFDCPLLIGVSRKSMIYNILDCTANDSLNGTTVLHTYSLLNGADILRVHDVKAAVEAIKIINRLKDSQ